MDLLVAGGAFMMVMAAFGVAALFFFAIRDVVFEFVGGGSARREIIDGLALEKAKAAHIKCELKRALVGISLAHRDRPPQMEMDFIGVQEDEHAGATLSEMLDYIARNWRNSAYECRQGSHDQWHWRYQETGLFTSELFVEHDECGFLSVWFDSTNPFGIVRVEGDWKGLPAWASRKLAKQMFRKFQKTYQERHRHFTNEFAAN